jgi:hypothetical protein
MLKNDWAIKLTLLLFLALSLFSQPMHDYAHYLRHWRAFNQGESEAVSVNDLVSLLEIDAGQLKFKPLADVNAESPSLVFQSLDFSQSAGGEVPVGPSKKLTIQSGAANDQNATADYIFRPADFGFAGLSAENQPIVIRVTELPRAGQGTLYRDANDNNILDRLSPWHELIEQRNDTPNAYGPLYLVFAPLSSLWDLLPRLIFQIGWICAVFYLLQLARQQDSPWLKYRLWNWIVLANPCLLFFTAFLGQLDALIAGLVLFSVVCWHRGREVTGGLLLATAVSIKFYPVVLLGASLHALRRGRYKFLLTVVLFVVGILAIAYAIWGSDCFAPLLFAGERESKILSIFRFMRGTHSPLRYLMPARGQGTPNIDFLSTYLLAGALLATSIAAWRMRWSIPYSCMVLAWCIPLFYKVGHANLFFWTLPLAYYFVLQQAEDKLTKGFVRAFTAYWAWLGGFGLLYMINWLEGPHAYLREQLGLPTFLLACWVMIALLRIAPTDVVKEPKAD